MSLQAGRVVTVLGSEVQFLPAVTWIIWVPHISHCQKGPSCPELGRMKDTNLCQIHERAERETRPP